jgi:hypothetical protein
MFRPKFSWNDYFSGTSITATLNQSFYNSRQTYSTGSVYVLSCLFSKCRSSSSGGALYCSSVTHLLIELTSFFSCKTDSQGGAIYFSNSGGQSVLHGVCGNDCCTTGSAHYQFAYINVNNGASSKNYVNYSSITRCVTDISNTYFTLYLNYGNIFCPSINMSMNKCYYYSGVYCYPYSDSSYVTCSLSYSSFTNNNSPDRTCLLFDRSGAKHEMKYCNVLRNTQGTSNYGIIYAYGNSMIQDCCILENTATYIFFVNNPSYYITLSNCTVDSTSYNRNLVIQSTATKSFIHGLRHMSTQNCHAQYDSAGALTAVPYVPSQTTRALSNCYCTCKRNHILERISVFFSLDWVFIITFIQTHH